MEFIKHHLPKGTKIFVPSPTWGNHNTIAKYCEIEVGSYKYWDKKTKGLDLQGMLQDLTNAPSKSVILLHVCAHNPTGVDPTQEQWKEIAKVCKEKKHICFFDNAYQGYASGDLAKDSFSVRFFEEQGFEMMVSQSFAKNIGLYGERIGAIHFVTNSDETAKTIDSQLKLIVRSIYSSPPLQGARIGKYI
jgi:aspartate aminotransferase, mitochondrial